MMNKTLLELLSSSKVAQEDQEILLAQRPLDLEPPYSSK
jgi:hypothetical protein